MPRGKIPSTESEHGSHLAREVAEVSHSQWIRGVASRGAAGGAANLRGDHSEWDDVVKADGFVVSSEYLDVPRIAEVCECSANAPAAIPDTCQCGLLHVENRAAIEQEELIVGDRLEYLLGCTLQQVQLTLTDSVFVCLRNSPEVISLLGPWIVEDLHIVRVPMFDPEFLIKIVRHVVDRPLAALLAVRTSSRECIVEVFEFEDGHRTHLLQFVLVLAPRTDKESDEGNNERGKTISVTQTITIKVLDSLSDVERVVEDVLVPFLLVVTQRLVLVDGLEHDLREEVGDDALHRLAIHAVGLPDVLTVARQHAIGDVGMIFRDFEVVNVFSIIGYQVSTKYFAEYISILDKLLFCFLLLRYKFIVVQIFCTLCLQAVRQ